MKKLLVIVGLGMCVMILPIKQAKAQIPIAAIIKAAVKKVIVAVDLKVQRLQNKTIWLQNAQKTQENKMSQLKLHEIRDWVQRQKKLYEDYYQELWKIKSALASYKRIKDIISQQADILKEYRSAWSLFRQDKNFTPGELDYMGNIYTGILEESAKNIDELFLIVNAFATQMSDARRLEIINRVGDQVQRQLLDLRDFNNQNKIVSLQRVSERAEIGYSRKIYGITR